MHIILYHVNSDVATLTIKAINNDELIGPDLTCESSAKSVG